MSIGLLEDPNKPHEILDDLEALFWSLLYATLHRFEHKSKFNMDIFNWYEPEQSDGRYTGRIVGGEPKRTALEKMGEKVEFTCKPLDTLIATLALELQDYYLYSSRAVLYKKLSAADPSNPQLTKKYDAMCTSRDEQHDMLSKPSFWRARFKEALDRKKEWVKDVSPYEKYPARTVEQGVKLFEASIATSQITGPVDVVHPVNPTTPTPHRTTEKTEKDSGVDASSCDEEDGMNANNDLDSAFIPLSEGDRDVGLPDLGSSPPTSPSHQLHITSFVSGYHSSSSEDDGPATPSKKRTHEDLDGAVARPLSKRHRSTDMPPPMLPPSRVMAGRSGQSRRAPASGELEGTAASGPSKYRSRE